MQFLVPTTLMVAAVGLSAPSPAAADQHVASIGSGRAYSYKSETWDVVSSTVEIRETNEPDAIAEVEYNNRPVNQSESDDGRYEVVFDNETYIIIFDHDEGGATQDTIEILPPDGLACRPTCKLSVYEEESGILYIIGAKPLF